MARAPVARGWRWLAGLCLLLGLASAAIADGGIDPRWRWLQAARAGAGSAPAVATAPPDNAVWHGELALYHRGLRVAEARGAGDSTLAASADAGRRLRTAQGAPAAHAQLRDGRLLLRLVGPQGEFAAVEHAGMAVEVVGDVTVVPTLSPSSLRQAVVEQREYLLRQIDRDHAAFFKLYDAATDHAETLLRTTYTASGLWTLLQLNDLQPDPRIAALIAPMTDYLLSMQVTEGAMRGAFHYSYDPSSQRKDQRFVVGTVSKTVFTLLDLHRRFDDPRHLRAALLAGEWLASRVRADGRVTATTRWSERKQRWLTFRRESVLYNCETLSALSRLAALTARRDFAEAAGRIAHRMLDQAKANRYFVGDGYRRPNNISTSWLAMAFLDYARISEDPRFIEAAFATAHRLSRRQITDPHNALDHGRYQDTWASSGNGWINEVMVETLRRCRALRRADCAVFEQDLLRASRWLIQNSYSPANSFLIANPARAQGGAIRDRKSEAVRTDAVCHAANSLVGVIGLLGPQAQLRLPASPRPALPP